MRLSEPYLKPDTSKSWPYNITPWRSLLLVVGLFVVMHIAVGIYSSIDWGQYHHLRC